MDFATPADYRVKIKGIEFKSRTKLIAFHIPLIPLGKV